MKFKVVIDVENAAFEDENMGTELARILREVADTVDGTSGETESIEGTLRDVNGNKVGQYRFEE